MREYLTTTLTFPEPEAGFRRAGRWARGPWRVWTDARVIDPAHHVPSFELRVWRAREGRSPALLSRFERARQVEVRLGGAGDVLVVAGRSQATLFPARGRARELGVAGASWLAPVAVQGDGVVFLAGAVYPAARLVFVPRSGGPPRELARGQGDRLAHAGLVRGGSRLCWLERDPDGRARQVRTLDLAGRAAPRDVPWRRGLPGDLALDGLAGAWIVAHAGDEVCLVHATSGRVHRLPAPFQVLCAHPRGVLCQGGGAGEDVRMVLWSPHTGAQTAVRIPRQPERGGAEEPFVSWDRGRLLVNGWRGLEPIPFAARGEESPPRTIDPSELLRTDDGNAAAYAARKLAFQGEAGRRALLEALPRCGDWYVQESMLESLGRVGRPADARAVLAVEMVIGLTATIARLLGRLGEPVALPWLRARRRLTFPMREQTVETRQAVTEAIARIEARPAALAAWAGLRVSR